MYEMQIKFVYHKVKKCCCKVASLRKWYAWVKDENSLSGNIRKPFFM